MRASFRSVLGHFATGITVITAMDDGEPVGIAANSFTSVSLDPPLVLFCAAKTSRTWPRIQRAGHFCVNVLDEHQEHISKLFATKGADRFGQIDWHVGERGPILHDVHAYLDCTIETEHDAGDHVIVVGRVHELGLDRGRRTAALLPGPVRPPARAIRPQLGTPARAPPAAARGLVCAVELGAEAEETGRARRADAGDEDREQRRDRVEARRARAGSATTSAAKTTSAWTRAPGRGVQGPGGTEPAGDHRARTSASAPTGPSAASRAGSTAATGISQAIENTNPASSTTVTTPCCRRRTRASTAGTGRPYHLASSGPLCARTASSVSLSVGRYGWSPTAVQGTKRHMRPISIAGGVGGRWTYGCSARPRCCAVPSVTSPVNARRTGGGGCSRSSSCSASIALFFYWRLVGGNPVRLGWPDLTIPPGLQEYLPGLILIVVLGGVLDRPACAAGRSPHTLYRPSEIPVTFDDVVGLGIVRDEVIKTLNLFLAFKTFRDTMGGTPRRAILFEGPPGTGKTYMAKAMAREAAVPFLFVSASAFQSMYYGQTNRKIRSFFKELRKTARA